MHESSLDRTRRIATVFKRHGAGGPSPKALLLQRFPEAPVESAAWPGMEAARLVQPAEAPWPGLPELPDAGWQGADILREAKLRLVLFDMDATVIEQECLDEIAAEAGPEIGAAIAAVTERAMRGELDFEAALSARLARLEGQPEALLDRVWERRIALTEGAAEAVAALRAGGARCVLVSGGFTYFTARVALAAGFDAHYGNELGAESGRLTGRAVPPLLDREAKSRILGEELAALGAPPAASAAVGDGANDAAMIRAAGTGIAFDAKPVLREAADAALTLRDLRAVPFLLGLDV